jgi:hypothetical protein
LVLTRVVDVRVSTARTWLTATAYILFVVGLSALGAMDQQKSDFTPLSADPAASPPTMSLSDQLVAASAELKRDLPKTLDDETRLDSVGVHSGNVLQYTYTLTEYVSTAEAVDRVEAILSTHVKTTIAPEVCKDISTRALLNIGAVMQYIYMDTQGSVVGAEDVTRETCEGILGT